MDFALTVDPALHRDKICDKTGDVTLDQDIVALYDMCLVDIGVIALCHHCAKK